MSDGLQQVINYMIPAVGTPRGYFWTGDLVAGTAVTIDFRNVSGGGIDGQPFRPSGVFIDNTRGTANLTVTVNEISYQMICLVGELLNLQFPAPIDVTISFTGEGEASLAFVDFPVLPYRNLSASVATVSWGSISGLLSDQTDLQAALDAKMDADIIDLPGELLYGAVGTGVPTALGIGSGNQVLTVFGGVPTWQDTAVEWGQITGVITAQADLGTALAAKQDNVVTTTGDIIYSSSGTTVARRAIGSTGDVLTVAGGVPTWAPPSGGGGSQEGIASSLETGNDVPFFHGMGPISGAALNATTRSHFHLMLLDSDVTITALSIACQTGTAAATIDVGIYNFLGAGKPGTCAASAQMSVATGGRKATTLGAPVALTAGLYYVMVHGSSISPTLAAISQNSTSADYQLSTAIVSDAFARFAGGSTTYNCVLLEDTNLPGGAYSIGMDLTGLTLSTSNIVAFNGTLTLVGGVKQ